MYYISCQRCAPTPIQDNVRLVWVHSDGVPSVGYKFEAFSGDFRVLMTHTVREMKGAFLFIPDPLILNAFTHWSNKFLSGIAPRRQTLKF